MADRRMPAEWEPHERTLMAWPCRRELWGALLEPARVDYATVANAIAEFEPVTLFANPGRDAAAARRATTRQGTESTRGAESAGGAESARGASRGVTVEELELDDSWLRDCGPIYVRDEPSGRRRAIHFRFNAWGERFTPYDADARAGGSIAQLLGDPVETAPLVLEGGSIASDGNGSLLTTEQCLLHPNRNPALGRDQIADALRRHLGAGRIVWLDQGLVEDRDTDGHIDLIAAPAPAGRVLLQTAPPGNPNYERAEENRARLAAAGYEVVEMPHLPYSTVMGDRVATGHLNLYVINGAVIVPVPGAETDADALGIIGDVFPGREIIPVPGAVLAYGGGGPHCITQQVPRR